MEFEQKKIGDICLSSCSGGTPKSTERSYYDGGTIPWLTTSEVNFKEIYDTENKITELGLEKSSAKYIPINSVIVAMYGVTAGRSAIAKIELTTNQACCNLQINEEIAHFRFVYYYLMMQSDQLNKLANGGAQQNLNSLIIKKFKIILPELLTQKKISQVLSNYDLLIENNNKRIKLLEKMAQELYKEWFVRFRFPGYEKTCFVDGIPECWKYVNLFEIGNVIYGFPFDSSKFCDDDSLNPVVRIRDIPGNNTFTYTSEVCDSKYIIKKNDILVGMDGIFHMCLWNGEYALLNQRVVKINSKKKDFSELLLYLSIYDQIKFWEATLCGTTVSHLGDKHLKRMKVLLPPKEVRVKTNNIFTNIMNEKANLLAKNKKLIKQRDSLLPRLMSGKVNLEDKEVI